MLDHWSNKAASARGRTAPFDTAVILSRRVKDEFLAKTASFAALLSEVGAARWDLVRLWVWPRKTDGACICRLTLHCFFLLHQISISPFWSNVQDLVINCGLKSVLVGFVFFYPSFDDWFTSDPPPHPGVESTKSSLGLGRNSKSTFWCWVGKFHLHGKRNIRMFRPTTQASTGCVRLCYAEVQFSKGGACAPCCCLLLINCAVIRRKAVTTNLS